MVMAWVCSCLLSESTYALNRTQARWIATQKTQGYLQRDYKSYQYPTCQAYNDDKLESYYAYCENGRIDYLPLQQDKSYHLELPAKILRKQDLEENLLKNLKKEITQKMKDQFHRLTLHYQCLRYANNPHHVSQYCSNIIKGYLDSTQEYLPQMRSSMAVMDTSYTSVYGMSNYGLDPGKLTKVKVEEDIEHPNFDHDIDPLSKEEQEALIKKRKEQRKKLETQFFSGENIEKKCAAPEARRETICQTVTIPKLYHFVRQHENQVIDESKAYYESIITQYPHLPYIRKGKLPKNNDEQIAVIKDAVKELYDQAQAQFEQWENAPLEDYKSFFHYPKVVAGILQDKIEYNKLQCDIIEGLHQTYGPGGSQETLRTIGIALGTLVGGGVCLMTGGLTCALGVAIVGEALSLAPDQSQLSLTQELYRSGVVEAKDVEADRDQRNFSAAMAPLSFVGLKGSQAIRSGSRTLSAETHGLQGLAKISDELFDSTKPLTKSHLSALLDYKATGPLQNKKWIELAKGANQREALFFDVENAVMKKLNDGLGDKNLVTSLTNLHKAMLQKEVEQWLKKYPELDIALYSDFKSLRFVLAGDLPAELKRKLKSEFASLTRKVNDQFKEKLSLLKGDIPETMPAADTWFKGGIGDSADQAGLAARKSRETRDTAAVDIDQLRGRIQVELGGIEGLRTKLGKSLPGELLDREYGIPNLDVIEFIRKKGGLHDSNPKAFREAFAQRFNHELNAQQASDLVDYLKQVDQFSPGLWMQERVVANLDRAEFGGFSADFKGMGAKNLQQVAIDLAKNPNSLDETLSTLRKGEAVVTESFDQNKNWYRDVVTKTLKEDGIKTTNMCSGDDCVSIPAQVLPDLTKQKIVRALAKHGAPDGQRLSFIPPGIQPGQRTLLAVHGELIEKQVRNQLTGFGSAQLPPDVLKKVAFAIDMPNDVGKGAPKLMISTAADFTLEPAQKEAITKAYGDIMKRVNKDIAQETGVETLYDPGQLIWVTQ